MMSRSRSGSLGINVRIASPTWFSSWAAVDVEILGYNTESCYKTVERMSVITLAARTRGRRPKRMCRRRP